MKKALAALLVLIALGAMAAYALVPWNDILKQRVLGMLAQEGFQDISLTVDSVGLHQAVLSDISIGKENPLRLRSLVLDYSLQELMDGNLRELDLKGLDLQIIETNAGWKLAGLDAFSSQAGEEKKPVDVPAILAGLPFETVSVSESTLLVSGKSLSGTFPFSAALSKTQMKLLAEPADLVSGANTISLGALALEASPDEKGEWKGEWALSSASFGDLPVPQLKAKGTLFLSGGIVRLEGEAASGDKTHRGTFSSLFNLNDAKENRTVIKSASFPFKEGTISTSNVTVKIPMTVSLQVRKVSVDALMQALTGKRVSATGTFSGSVPVTIKSGGGFAVGKGSLKADTDGVIQMPPDVIPGDNAQVQLVRDVLENLQYSLLSASVAASKGNKMTVTLHLEGRNPDVYNGRPIKLNVNLTGDLLDFIQQNIMLFNTPEKILEQQTR